MPCAKLVVSNNPLGLVEVIQDYGVSEFGGLFVYLPHPRRNSNRQIWGWIEAMRLSDAIVGGPWQVRVDAVYSRLSDSHAKLLDGNPTHFEIYRLDRKRLADLMR
ncbi:MAG: hypothetical protein AAGA75_16950 [Cyanobacteria bacterium P01_E01_bin.6]